MHHGAPSSHAPQILLAPTKDFPTLTMLLQAGCTNILTKWALSPLQMSKERLEGLSDVSKVTLWSLGLYPVSPQPPGEMGCEQGRRGSSGVREGQPHSLSWPSALLGTHLAPPGSRSTSYRPELGISWEETWPFSGFPFSVPHPTGAAQVLHFPHEKGY